MAARKDAKAHRFELLFPLGAQLRVAQDRCHDRTTVDGWVRPHGAHNLARVTGEDARCCTCCADDCECADALVIEGEVLARAARHQELDAGCEEGAE